MVPFDSILYVINGIGGQES